MFLKPVFTCTASRPPTVTVSVLGLRRGGFEGEARLGATSEGEPALLGATSEGEPALLWEWPEGEAFLGGGAFRSSMVDWGRRGF